MSSGGNDTVDKVTATNPKTATTTATDSDVATATAAAIGAPATIDATERTELQRIVSKFIENKYFQLFVTAIILVASVSLVTMASFIHTILIYFVGFVRFF